MKQLNVTKILSTSLSLALAITSVPISASAAGPIAPAFVSKLTPPEQFGYVASSFAPKGEEKPRLIVIADLHAHVQVQRNIMGMLSSLVPTLKAKSGNKVPVFLEGGWESNLEEPLQKMTDSKVRRFFDEYYLQKSEIGGPQAYSEQIAGSGQVTMIGVENKAEYLANKSQFSKTYPERRQLLQAIKLQEASMRLLSEQVEGRSYLKLQQLRDDYNAGRLPTDRYVKSLLRYVDRFHMEGRYATALKNYSTSSPVELDMALANVYREISVRLSEKRPMTAFLRQQFGNETIIRSNLARVDADLDLLKRLVANQLTPSEVTLAMSRLGQLTRTAELLLEGQTLSVKIGDVLRHSLEFYPIAFLRDETLVKNSLAQLEKMGPDATGILVAGGFHVEAIASYMAEHKIPNMVINPTITRDLTTEEQLNYVKRMGGDHITAQEVASDLEWIKSGRQSAMDAMSSGVSVIATKDSVMQPGDPNGAPKSQDFLNGYKAIVDDIKANGDLYAQNMGKYSQQLLDSGLDLSDAAAAATVLAPTVGVMKTLTQEVSTRLAAAKVAFAQEDISTEHLSAGMPGTTLKRVSDGKQSVYLEVGRVDNAPMSQLEIYINNQMSMSSEKSLATETVYVQTLRTRAGLLELVGESKTTRINAKESVVSVVLDRYLQAKAEPAAAGSLAESHQMNAAHTFNHEFGHVANPNATEEAVTAHSYAVAAVTSPDIFGEGAGQRFAAAASKQFALGDVKVQGVTSKSLAEGVASYVSPKASRVASVQLLANKFAEQHLVEGDREQILSELKKMQGSVEYDLALAGYDSMLLKRLRLQLAQLYAVASAA